MNILQIKSSILGENSLSSKYTDKLVDILSKQTMAKVKVRDVAANPVSPLSGESLKALQDPNSSISKEHLELIWELKNADTIVMAAPMYNFTIPTTLKNYFDAISKIGITFKYTDKGQIGLLGNKKTYVVLTRGGKFKEQGMTFQEDFIKVQLGFLGLTDVHFIFLEGSGMGVKSEELDESFVAQL